MASTTKVDSKQCLALMHAHIQILIGKANKVKISNLKTIKKLRVINEEGFKVRVKEILNL
jgi:hypothetical protein